ncbi:hypothetical protein FXO38_01232 [Capsicum annuum]|nr:hypothetical protein FXO38_01232 [Capsicum annuum]
MEFMKFIYLKSKNSFLDSKGGRDRWMNISHTLVKELPKFDGKSEAKERYENDIMGCGQGFIDGDEENKSTEEEEDKQEKEGEESEKEDDDLHNDNASSTRRELISKSQHEAVKTISIDRKTIKNENIEELFKKSCFRHFLALLEDHTSHSQLSMVYGLLKYKINYVRDDKHSKERGKKMDTIWINYGGMPVCFSLTKFSTVIGLRYDHLEEPLIKETPHKSSTTSRIAKPPPPNRGKALSQRLSTKTNKCKKKINVLLNIVGHGYKAYKLIKNLKDKTISKKYDEKLCLAWFTHSVISVRDVNKVIEDDLLKLAEDFEKFNNYP